MELIPDRWIEEPLEGSDAYRDVPYITELIENKVFQCLLCDTGELKSPSSCEEHCKGRRHSKNYLKLKRRQAIWLLEVEQEDRMLEIEQRQKEYRKLMSKPKEQHSKVQAGTSPDDCFDEEVHSQLPYIFPFKRWHHTYWVSGWTCQLCCTRDLPTRAAVVQHCQQSRRHATFRAMTLQRHISSSFCWTPTAMSLSSYSSYLQTKQEQQQKYLSHKRGLSKNPFAPIECLVVLEDMQKRLESPVDCWRIQCAMYHYMSAKELSFDGFASCRYEWCKVLEMTQRLQLRQLLTLLELAIWKEHCLSDIPSFTKSAAEELMDQSSITSSSNTDSDDPTSLSQSFCTMSDMEDYITSHGMSFEEFKSQKRLTCGVYVITQGVLPFLVSRPATKSFE